MALSLLNYRDFQIGPTYSFDSATDFPVGSPVYHNGTGLVLANGSDSSTDAQFVIVKKIQKAVGWRYSVVSSGIVTLSDAQWKAVNGGTSLVVGSRYFVSSTSGIYSTTPVTTINISMPILVAVSTTQVFVYTNTFSQRVRKEVDITNSGAFIPTTNPRTLSMVDILGASISSGVYKFYLKSIPTVGGVLRFANQSGSYNTLYSIETPSEWIGGVKDTANKLNIYVESNIIRFQNKLGSSSHPAGSITNPNFPINSLSLVFVSDI
jgi:hypothetical protein